MKLKSLNSKFPDIALPRIGESLILGRSRSTGLRDSKISKEHLRISVLRSDKIEVLQIGCNSSSLQSEALSLRKGQRASLSPNDTLQFLQGTDYLYQFVTKQASEKDKNILETKPTIVEPSKMKHGHWSMGLLSSLKDPSLHLYKDELMVIIKDAYPKAQHHFLALPSEDIPSHKSLSSKHLPLLEHLLSKSKEFLRLHHPHRQFRLGFHAIPSMKQIHMHLISQDFLSPCLKNKKHWNSFNTSFFIEASDFIGRLESRGALDFDEEEYSGLLKRDLKCHVCGFKPANMPKLKEHLIEHNK